MVYLGHFSFESHESGMRGLAIWRGDFTCVAKADSVETALEKFEALLLRLHRTSNIFSDVKEVYLDACIEIRSVPKGGFLSYYCETRGECQERIATFLAGTTGQDACSYELATNADVENGDASAVEPFLVFPT